MLAGVFQVDFVLRGHGRAPVVASVLPTGLTPGQAAKIIAAAGSRRITEAMVLADIEAGARSDKSAKSPSPGPHPDLLALLALWHPGPAPAKSARA